MQRSLGVFSHFFLFLLLGYHAQKGTTTLLARLARRNLAAAFRCETLIKLGVCRSWSTLSSIPDASKLHLPTVRRT